MKVTAEIVNGKCPTCDEFTMLVGLSKEIYRCMNCGTDLQQFVNGKCPTCDEFTMLVGLTKQVYRCMNCGTDLEQFVNGKIVYLPHITKKTEFDIVVKDWVDGEKI